MEPKENFPKRQPDGRDILRSAFSLFWGHFGYIGSDLLAAGGRVHAIGVSDRALAENEIKELADSFLIERVRKGGAQFPPPRTYDAPERRPPARSCPR